MINLQDFSREQQQVLMLYKGRCIVHPERISVTIHEEPPKSLNPNWMNEPDTWYPVCPSCHEYVHSVSRDDAQEFLSSNRDRNFPDTV